MDHVAVSAWGGLSIADLDDELRYAGLQSSLNSEITARSLGDQLLFSNIVGLQANVDLLLSSNNAYQLAAISDLQANVASLKAKDDDLQTQIAGTAAAGVLLQGQVAGLASAVSGKADATETTTRINVVRDWLDKWSDSQFSKWVTDTSLQSPTKYPVADVEKVVSGGDTFLKVSTFKGSPYTTNLEISDITRLKTDTLRVTQPGFSTSYGDVTFNGTRVDCSKPFSAQTYLMLQDGVTSASITFNDTSGQVTVSKPVQTSRLVTDTLRLSVPGLSTSYMDLTYNSTRLDIPKPTEVQTSLTIRDGISSVLLSYQDTTSTLTVNKKLKPSGGLDMSLTASRALVSSGTGDITVSTTSATELGYVNGVTSAIQTQLNDRLLKLATTDNKRVPFVKTDGSGLLQTDASLQLDTTLNQLTVPQNVYSPANAPLRIGTSSAQDVYVMRNSVNRLTVSDTGVGVGTAAPSGLLHVTGSSGAAALNLTQSGAGSLIDAKKGADTKFLVRNDGTTYLDPVSTTTALTVKQTGTGDCLDIMDGSLTKLTVKGDGRVGVNISNPSLAHRFHVSGDSKIDGTLTVSDLKNGQGKRALIDKIDIVRTTAPNGYYIKLKWWEWNDATLSITTAEADRIFVPSESDYDATKSAAAGSSIAAGEAAASASAAASSASAAAGSAAAAAGSAAAAATSATAAATAAAGAAGSSTGAGLAASDASTSASAAASAKNSAENARDAAQGYRDAAQGFRNEAQTFRDQAQTFSQTVFGTSSISNGAVTAEKLDSVLGVLMSIAEYPPAAMTAETTALSGQVYGNGTYVASSSTFYNASYPSRYAFDRNLTTAWICGNTRYATDGSYPNAGVTTPTVTTYNSNLLYSGEWLQLQLPGSICLTRFQITARNNTSRGDPRDFALFGSTDGTNWTLLFQTTAQTFANSQMREYVVSGNSTPYSYYRLAANRINTTMTYFAVGELRLIGYANPGTRATPQLYCPAEVSASMFSGDAGLLTNVANTAISGLINDSQISGLAWTKVTGKDLTIAGGWTNPSGGGAVNTDKFVGINVPAPTLPLQVAQSGTEILRCYTDTTALQFPLAALTANTVAETAYDYAGSYVVTSSRDENTTNSNWRVFDRNINTYWSPVALASLTTYYSNTTPFAAVPGVTITQVDATTNVAGEWLQIQTPVPIVCTKVELQNPATTHRPSVYDVYGSLTGNAMQWTLLGTSSTALNNVTVTMIPPTQTESQFFRLVVRNVSGVTNTVKLHEMRVFGYKKDLVRVGVKQTTPAYALDVGGEVKATKFIGDGATFLGTVTAGGFAGSGAGLTGVPGSAITSASITSDKLASGVLPVLTDSGWTRSGTILSLTNSADTVGLGTAAPGAKLDIVGTGDGTKLLQFSTDRAWYFQQSSANATAALRLTSAISGKEFQLFSQVDSTYCARFLCGAAPRTYLYGSVGVNTQTPATELHVQGNVTANVYFGSGASLTGITASQISGLTNSALTDTSNASNILTGTLPIARIADGSVTNAKLASDLDASKLTAGLLPIARVQDGTVTLAKLAADAVSGWVRSSNTVQLTTSSDKVGIGTAPSYELHVLGSARMERPSPYSDYAYPPVAMTTNSTVVSGQAYGNGTWIASASSVAAGSAAYAAFDNNTSTIYASAANYTAATGNATAISVTNGPGGSYNGEHLTLQGPAPYMIISISVTASGATSPKSFRLYGSTSGASGTWLQLLERTGETTFGATETRSYQVTSPGNYQYYRLAVNQINSAGATTALYIASVNMYGLNTADRVRLFEVSSDDVFLAGGTRGSVVIGSDSLVPAADQKLLIAGNCAISGNSILSFSSWGGGFQMVDGTWIRTTGNKSFYHNAGNLRTDGTLQVGLNGGTLSVPSGGDFAYRTNTLVATTAGRVGIGTTNPQYALEVIGDVNIQGNFRRGTAYTAYPTAGLLTYLTVANLTLPAAGAAWWDCMFKVTQGGTGRRFLARCEIYAYQQAHFVNGTPVIRLFYTNSTQNTEDLRVYLSSSPPSSYGTQHADFRVSVSGTTVTIDCRCGTNFVNPSMSVDVTLSADLS